MKQLAIVLAALLTLGLTACGGETDNAEPTAAEIEELTEEPTEQPTLSAGDKAACSTYNAGMTETHEVMDKIVSGKKLVPFLTVTIVNRSADSVRSAASVATSDLTDAMEQTADSLILYSEGIEAGDVSVSHPAVVEADDAVSEMCKVS